MAAAPMILFDHINKSVAVAGTNAESDRQIQEFLQRQQLQAVKQQQLQAGIRDWRIT